MCEQQIVFSRNAGRGIPVFADVEGGIDVEPVGRQTLQSRRSPGAVGILTAIVSNTQLRIPEGGYCVAPEQFGAKFVEFSGIQFTFQFEIGAIVCTPVPTLSLERKPAVVVRIDLFETVNQDRTENMIHLYRT